MRIGIQGSGQLPSALPDPGRYRAVAELAEELGYDSLWAGEHLSFHNPILDLGVALATFAAVTRRIAIGAAVVLLPLRHPSLVAKQAASLDYVSGGRLLLGLGVGGEGHGDFEAAGVPLAERGARADEGIEALRALLRDRPASFDGRYFRFAGVSIEPPPTQPGGPPLLVGGRSDAAIRRAARHGDGWLPYMLSAGRYARGLASLDAEARRVGRESAERFRGLVLFAHVDDDGERARAEAMVHLSERYGMPFERHHVERLCVVGTPEECLARVDEYRAAGAEHVSFNPAVGEDGFLEQVRRIREVVGVGAPA
ncbi:MAG TPA: LLM class flavin-dependent oxidoreductase [Gaiellaceae bacterium]